VIKIYKLKIHQWTRPMRCRSDDSRRYCYKTLASNSQWS